MIITANSNQIDAALAIAMIRTSNKQSWQNKRYANPSDFEVHYIGALAEIIFSQLIGVEPDYNQYVHGDEYDFLINGLTIDVKCRRARNGKIDLAIFEDNPWYLKCDLYVLAIYDENTISFEGFCSKIMFNWYGECKKLKDWRWCIDGKYLKDVGFLIERLTR